MLILTRYYKLWYNKLSSNCHYRIIYALLTVLECLSIESFIADIPTVRILVLTDERKLNVMEWILLALAIVIIVMLIINIKNTKKSRTATLQKDAETTKMPDPTPEQAENVEKESSPSSKDIILNNITDFYSLKKSVMNNEEQLLYYLCESTIEKNSNYQYLKIFTQVRVADFIRIKDYQYIRNDLRKNQYTAKKQVLPLSVDFLICRRIKLPNGKYSYVPAAVLEYDGAGHDTSTEGKARDAFKDKLFKQLDLEFWRIKNEDLHSEAVENIFQIINNQSYQKMVKNSQ